VQNDKNDLNELWQHYFSNRGIEERDSLIVMHLFLVKYVVGKIGNILPTHIKLEDLYSSGVTGLIKAVEKYDPAKNNKFESYAILLIKGAIIDELRELDWIPRSIHQKANLISSAQEALRQTLGRDPTDEELSYHLGVSEKELSELLFRVRPAILIPLNAEFSHNDDDNAPISERIADVKAETSFEAADRNEYAVLLGNAVAELPEQEKKVLTLYYYEELMLKEIGKIMGISESRVSQIHTKALLKLRSRLRSVSDVN
jgi:RNA polymerase sigma factor for flagellar operon FliA